MISQRGLTHVAEEYIFVLDWNPNRAGTLEWRCIAFFLTYAHADGRVPHLQDDKYRDSVQNFRRIWSKDRETTEAFMIEY